VPSLFVVENAKGPDYDRSRGRREQVGWDEHAAFMDGLLERGMIVIGGPVGHVDEGEHTLLVIRAEDEAAVRAAFAEDPWHETVLHLARVEPWTLWLGGLV
jgi:uncharacterized protein YciI